jgi:hypothetical protein
MYAIQCDFKELIQDPMNSVSDRCDALVLYAWLGKFSQQQGSIAVGYQAGQTERMMFLF